MTFSWKLLLVLLLAFYLTPASTIIFAEEIEQNPQRLIKLAKNMEDFGYLKSAKHYYSIVYRNPKISKTQRLELDKTLSLLDEKIEAKNINNKPLENLSDFSHFINKDQSYLKTSGILKKPISATAMESSNFPSPRINKTKWFLTTVAIIAIGLIVNKQLEKDEPVSPNPATIGF